MGLASLINSVEQPSQLKNRTCSLIYYLTNGLSKGRLQGFVLILFTLQYFHAEYWNRMSAAAGLQSIYEW
jgi:hypothetical protein